MTLVKTPVAGNATTAKANNGTLPSNVPAANVTEDVKKAEQKVDVIKTPEKFGDKVARVCDLYETIQKLETLEETKKELKSFKTSNANLSCSLTISDNNGKRFHTNNSEAIGLLVEELKTILDKKIEETKALIVL